MNITSDFTSLTNHQNPVATANLKPPKKVVLWAKFLQFLSNELATKFTVKLLSTPLKIKAPEREIMFRKSSKMERLIIDDINTEIQVYSYGYSKTKVLLVHGWSGRGSQMYQLADKLLENKMMVVSFDGPAHGLSKGKTTNMMAFISAIKEVNDKYGPFGIAIGHSFGAMSLINAIAGKMKVKKLILIGADNSIPDLINAYVEKLELKPAIFKNIKRIYEKKYRKKLKDISSENQAKKIAIPTFVIHDSADRYVDVSCAFAIRQKLKKGRLLITHGLGHNRILNDPGIMRKIIEFIQ